MTKYSGTVLWFDSTSHKGIFTAPVATTNDKGEVINEKLREFYFDASIIRNKEVSSIRYNYRNRSTIQIKKGTKIEFTYNGRYVDNVEIVDSFDVIPCEKINLKSSSLEMLVNAFMQEYYICKVEGGYIIRHEYDYHVLKTKIKSKNEPSVSRIVKALQKEIAEHIECGWHNHLSTFENILKTVDQLELVAA